MRPVLRAARRARGLTGRARLDRQGDGRSLRNAQIFEINLSFFDGKTDGQTDLGRQLGALDQARDLGAITPEQVRTVEDNASQRDARVFHHPDVP